MSNTLVSIITPSYNSEKFIEKTIKSIVSQTHKNWELLITDDCSFDNSIAIINSYASIDERIKLFKLKKNQGAGVARNKSISKAKGRYIAFCDSDDQWDPIKLEKQIAFLEKKKLCFTYSSYEIVNENDMLIGKVTPPLEIDFKKMLNNNYVGCLTGIYDSRKIGKQFMPKIRRRQDWLLWLNILKKFGSTEGMPDILAKYRIRSNSISRNKIQLLKFNWLVYRKELEFSYLKSFYLLLNFLLHYAKKKIIK